MHTVRWSWLCVVDQILYSEPYGEGRLEVCCRGIEVSRSVTFAVFPLSVTQSCLKVAQLHCSESVQELQSRCIMTYSLPSSDGGGTNKHQLIEQTQFLYPSPSSKPVPATVGALCIQRLVAMSSDSEGHVTHTRHAFLSLWKVSDTALLLP